MPKTEIIHILASNFRKMMIPVLKCNIMRALGYVLLAGAADGFASLRPVPARQAVETKAAIIPVGAQAIAAVPPMTYEEVTAAAAYWGCRLEMTVLGPAYRVELRQTAWRRTEPRVKATTIAPCALSPTARLG